MEKGPDHTLHARAGRALKQALRLCGCGRRWSPRPPAKKPEMTSAAASDRSRGTQVRAVVLLVAFSDHKFPTSYHTHKFLHA